MSNNCVHQEPLGLPIEVVQIGYIQQHYQATARIYIKSAWADGETRRVVIVVLRIVFMYQ